MDISKKWYWAVGSLVVLGVAFLYRRKGKELWHRAMNHRRAGMTAEGR